jgi:hypothetical protein
MHRRCALACLAAAPRECDVFDFGAWSIAKELRRIEESFRQCGSDHFALTGHVVLDLSIEPCAWRRSLRAGHVTRGQGTARDAATHRDARRGWIGVLTTRPPAQSPHARPRRRQKKGWGSCGGRRPAKRASWACRRSTVVLRRGAQTQPISANSRACGAATSSTMR